MNNTNNTNPHNKAAIILNGFLGQLTFYLPTIQNILISSLTVISQSWVMFLLLDSIIGAKAVELMPFINTLLVCIVPFQSSLNVLGFRLFFERYNKQIQSFTVAPTPDIVQICAYLLSSVISSTASSCITIIWYNSVGGGLAIPIENYGSFFFTIILTSILGSLLGMVVGLLFDEAQSFIPCITILTTTVFITAGIVTQFKGMAKWISFFNPAYHAVNIVKTMLATPIPKIARSFLSLKNVSFSASTSYMFLLGGILIFSIIAPLLYSFSKKIRS